MTQDTKSSDPRAVLRAARIIWLALLAGLLAAGLVFAWVVHAQPGNPADDDAAVTVLFLMSIAMPLVSIPIGLFLRGQVFKSGWVGDVVEPMSYLRGNILAWALCEGPALLSLITALLAREFWPYAAPAGVCWVVLALLWPNGKALFRFSDEYATRRVEP